MKPYRLLISTNSLADNLDHPQLKVIDCRFSLMDTAQGRSHHAAGHIPGASYADLDQDLAAPVSEGTGRHPLPDIETFVATLRRWGISNDSQVVVYDDAGGGVAARLWWMLRWLGHRDVALLDGGYAAWVREGNSVTTEDSVPVLGTFVPTVSKDVIWTTEDIASWVSHGDSFLLVDARDGTRFNGEHEPIDPVAGHVPGAVSLPLTETLSADGTWLGVDEIKARWSAIPGIGEDRQWGVMCGSGVTACHLALSASIAGLSDPCLYIGSWSEWVSEPERPIATENSSVE